ncbi:hypothetical protein IV203_016822 [Nitzschia inconspicua]|uniref:Uncharacterized protein n=1 Tax=Nitzschia inconspicua TaxID=303405 RepID=A0A9K3PHR1_9STRA|nr:hypothetical protein IV203_016822 [Nitzschia inconspicua]
MRSTTATVALCLSTASAFQVSTHQKTFTTTKHASLLQRRRERHYRFSLSAKPNKSNNGSGPGMEDAFRQLEKLSSLDESKTSSLMAETTQSLSEQEQKKKRDAAFAKAMKELNLKDIIDDPPEVPTESEVELYKDMATELSAAASEDDLVADLKSDLDMEEVVTPTIDAKNEIFMNKAIDEALKEAKEQDGEVVEKESLLDNKEIMAEIEKIFDRANDKLLEGLEEIRSEQMLLARQSAERNAKVSQAKIEEDEQRLALAEANMKKMLERVNRETRNVEEAIADLKRAQEESEGGLDGQLSSIKSGGVVKQAALAGALLFTLRAGVDTVGFLAGDPSHAFPALLQGALAIICIVSFIFL